jgi:dihydrofolate reductase/thymidylate synthase
VTHEKYATTGGFLSVFSSIPFYQLFLFLWQMCSLAYAMQILKINPEKKDIDSFVAADFKLISYDPHQKIEMKMAV